MPGLMVKRMTTDQDSPLAQEANEATLTYSLARTRVRELRPHDDESKIHVVLAGNCSMEFMTPGVQIGLMDAGYTGVVDCAPYDSWISEVLADRAAGDAWVIWISAMAASARGHTKLASRIVT